MKSKENVPIGTNNSKSTICATNCCGMFKGTFEMCQCCFGKKKKKDDQTWQKNIKTLTVTDQPLKSACNVWTTNYDATSTITAAEAISNHNMQKSDRSSFQHWLTPPPNGTVYPFFPQPEVDKITTVINNENFCESTDKTSQDAWYFSGMFTQENPHKSKEVTEL